MALVTETLTFATGTVAASGTSVAPSAAVPDNCDIIYVTNPDTVKTGLVGIATAGAALTAGVNAQRVPAGMTLPFPVGLFGSRTALSSLVFDSIGGALVLEITYFNTFGG